jgi:perosamine synthetase
MRVPLSQPWITPEDIDSVLSVLRSPILSIGPKVQAFEQAMARYAGTAEAVAVNSGTSGLHLCLAALGVGAGDEVVTTPFSFVASANAALYQGAVPVFADINLQTLTIDPAQAEARISPRTRAILPVDVFGQPAAMEAIAAIAGRHGLAVVRDACEAIGAERNGCRAGADGTPSVFAFYPNKQMTTGEGGIITTGDPALARVLRSLCNQGRDDNGTWMNHVRLGYNYRLDEMSAALGVTQLARIDQILDRRARVAAWYNERLASIEAVRTPLVAPETTRMSWFVYVIRLAPEIDRAALMAALEAGGVPTRPYFVPIHLQPLYRERFGYGEGDFPVTEAVARTTLALPFFTTMTEAQVDHVCGCLRTYLERRRGTHTRRAQLGSRRGTMARA